ncbi:MAG: hypothetical protein LIO58_05145 [Oscillospiraceae bacterium]|nr:hypothetical protein [Oscillospiraceae bacterium]
MTKSFFLHLARLLFCGVMFCIGVYYWLTNPTQLDFTSPAGNRLFLSVIWLFLCISILLRLVPNPTSAIGARKHFARYYKQAPETGGKGTAPLHRGVLLSAAAWIIFNVAVLLVAHSTGLLSPATALLLVLLYAVCDVVCILFFCPFQLLFLRNRCCSVCRIYNWDCMMLCTPFLLYLNLYSLPLVILAALLLVLWERSVFLNPHYFSAQTNIALRCANCTDRFCHLRGKIHAPHSRYRPCEFEVSVL